MRKAFIHSVCMAVLACICLAFSPEAGAESAGIKNVWKFASLAPDRTAWALPIKNIVFPLIEKETDGQVRTKVYWGGIMGDDEDILKKMRIGQLDGAGFSAQGATLAVPEMTVLELPFLFNDYDEVDLIKYTMYSTFDQYMDQRGLFLIAWVDQDFDQIYSTDRPVASLADFRVTRFASWYGPLEERFLKGFGAAIVPVNVPELSSTIRQGVVDAHIGPAMWMVGTQLYSVCKYVNPMNFRYSPGVMVCRSDIWESYPEMKKYKKRIEQLRVPLTEAFCTIIRENNKAALKAMVQYGLTPVKTDPRSLETMKAQSRSLWYTMSGDLYPRQLLDEILERLSMYRDIPNHKDMALKKDEVFGAIKQKRKKVLEIWEAMGKKPANQKDLDKILYNINQFNELYNAAVSEAKKARAQQKKSGKADPNALAMPILNAISEKIHQLDL